MIIACLAAIVPLGGGTVSAQTTAPAQPDPQQQQKMIESLPWAVRLGFRSHQVSQAFPVVDRVVLVPDAATYFDELSKWSPQGRWPVLIEDARFAPLFVRRFAPAQLVRRASVNRQLPATPVEKQRMLESIVIGAFGGDQSSATIRDAFATLKYVSPGVVIASVNDSGWTAAVALAAGRAQPLEWLDDNFGGPNDVIANDLASKLIASVDQLVAKQQYPYKTMGDAIDTVTICRSMAVACNLAVAADQQPPVPAPHNAGPIALTDLIGRNADGTRYAYTGWIFGDEIRCAYMAMCSLFLPREQVIMYNGYPLDGPWASYSMAEAIDVLRQAGYSVRDFDTANADEQAWQRMLTSGVAADLFVMNSKGNADFFDLFAGRGTPGDVPTLNQPLALHLIHSWSMKSPDDDRTVGARWLDHGAYAAVGSCWEPMLSAFVPPPLLARRIGSFVPFLVAARWWDGEPGIAQRWRVVTIGDPLMLALPQTNDAKPRVRQPAAEGEDLNERVKTLIREASSDKTGKAAAEAIAILNMLGRDQVAAEVWKLARQQHASAPAARQALDVLFRLRDVEQFREAWREIDQPDDLAQDMLWHMAFSRVGPGNAGAHRDLLQLLQENIRESTAVSDVQRLAPHVARVAGVDEVRIMIQRTISKVKAQYLKDELAELMKQY